MEWYHLFTPLTEKVIAFAILAICFALILFQKLPIRACNGGMISIIGSGEREGI
jgi:hypothetical protein